MDCWWTPARCRSGCPIAPSVAGRCWRLGSGPCGPWPTHDPDRARDGATRRAVSAGSRRRLSGACVGAPLRSARSAPAPAGAPPSCDPGRPLRSSRPGSSSRSASRSSSQARETLLLEVPARGDLAGLVAQARASTRRLLGSRCRWAGTTHVPATGRTLLSIGADALARVVLGSSRRCHHLARSTGVVEEVSAGHITAACQRGGAPRARSAGVSRSLGRLVLAVPSPDAELRSGVDRHRRGGRHPGGRRPAGHRGAHAGTCHRCRGHHLRRASSAGSCSQLEESDQRQRAVAARRRRRSRSWPSTATAGGPSRPWPGTCSRPPRPTAGSWACCPTRAWRSCAATRRRCHCRTGRRTRSASRPARARARGPAGRPGGAHPASRGHVPAVGLRGIGATRRGAGRTAPSGAARRPGAAVG